MTGRLLPGEGELPLGEIVSAALANSPALTIEVEVFSEELGAMTADAAAARTAAAVAAWRAA
jgi:sugar phosphate isomerase/epimerase